MFVDALAVVYFLRVGSLFWDFVFKIAFTLLLVGFWWCLFVF